MASPPTGTRALGYVADGLKRIKAEHGVGQCIGARGLGPPHGGRVAPDGQAGARPGQREASTTAAAMPTLPTGGPGWSGAVVGHCRSPTLSQPGCGPRGGLFPAQGPSAASRSACARRPARAGQVLSLNAVHDDWAMPVAARITVAPSGWAQALADVAGYVASGQRRGRACTRHWSMRDAEAVAQALMAGEQKGGAAGQRRPRNTPKRASCWPWPQWIGAAHPAPAWATWAPRDANTVGAQLVNALPGVGRAQCRPNAGPADEGPAAVGRGADASTPPMPAAAKAALAASGLVVAFTSFKDAALWTTPTCCCPSPRSPRRPVRLSMPRAGCRASTAWSSRRGDARPAWKVLRVSWANLLGLDRL